MVNRAAPSIQNPLRPEFQVTGGDQAVLHALHLAHGLLHMGGAGRAAHAAHPKPLFHIASPICTPPPREGVLVYRHSIHPGNSLVNNKVSLDERP